jgi:hypothetical protein
MTATAVLQRKCACGSGAEKSGECSQCAQRKQELQRKRTEGKDPQHVPDIVHSVIGSSGRPLEPGVRETMQSRFGHSFNDVRIHADDRAGESARAVNAQAYTVRNHIVFQPALYEPHTPAGRRLIAHELTHVTQQRNASSAGPPGIGDAHSEAEGEADRKADSVMSGKPAGAPNAAAPALRRQPADDYKLPHNPAYDLKLDPKITAEFLARCDMGKGDPKLCAEVRAKFLGKPLPDSKPADLNPANYDFSGIVGRTTFGIPPGAGTSPLAPLAPKPPGAPGPAPQSPGKGPDFSGLKNAIDKVTKFHIKTSKGTIDISLPTSITAKFRPLANAQEIVITASAEVSGTLSAAFTIDGKLPVSVIARVDAGTKTASLSLTLDSAAIGSACELKVPVEAIAKVTDARDKLVALIQQRVTHQQAAPDPLVSLPNKSDPPRDLSIAKFKPDPKKSSTDNSLAEFAYDVKEGARVTGAAVGEAVDAVKEKVGPTINSVQPEIELAKAIAAFVDAVSAVKEQNKRKCGPSVRLGVTGQVPIGDPDPKAPGLGTALQFGIVGRF